MNLQQIEELTTTQNGSTVEAWKTRVLELCKKGGVSMVEVSRMEGATGESTLWGDENQTVVIWMDLHANLTRAISELIEERRLAVRITSPMIYLMDGGTLKLPIAKKANKSYKTPHWAPVVLALAA